LESIVSAASEKFSLEISKEPIHDILDQQQVQGSDKVNLFIGGNRPPFGPSDVFIMFY
jgi:hypothetical protein